MAAERESIAFQFGVVGKMLHGRGPSGFVNVVSCSFQSQAANTSEELQDLGEARLVPRAAPTLEGRGKRSPTGCWE